MTNVLELYGISTLSDTEVDWFAHLQNALIGDSAHFHVYKLQQRGERALFQLELSSRFSTDANGIAECFGLQTNQRMELEEVIRVLESKISDKTLFTFQ